MKTSVTNLLSVTFRLDLSVVPKKKKKKKKCFIPAVGFQFAVGNVFILQINVLIHDSNNCSVTLSDLWKQNCLSILFETKKSDFASDLLGEIDENDRENLIKALNFSAKQICLLIFLDKEIRFYTGSTRGNRRER